MRAFHFLLLDTTEAKITETLPSSAGDVIPDDVIPCVCVCAPVTQRPQYDIITFLTVHNLAYIAVQNGS